MSMQRGLLGGETVLVCSVVDGAEVDIREFTRNGFGRVTAIQSVAISQLARQIEAKTLHATIAVQSASMGIACGYSDNFFRFSEMNRFQKLAHGLFEIAAIVSITRSQLAPTAISPAFNGVIQHHDA